VIQRLAALFCRADQDVQVLFHLVLADQVFQLLRSQSVVDAVIGLGFGVNGSFGGIGHIRVIINQSDGGWG